MMAEQLNGYISTNEDNNSVVWNEKNYTDSKTTMDSSQPVIFLGKTEVSKAIEPIMDWKYSKLNMKYGWQGKKAIISVEPHDFTKDEIQELNNILGKFKKETESNEFKSKFGKIASAYLSSNFLFLLGPVGLIAQAANAVSRIVIGKTVYQFGKDKIRDEHLITAEASLLVYEFFKHGLSNFLGEKPEDSSVVK